MKFQKFAFALIPVSVAGLQSYRGTDAGFQVTCPLLDYVAQPCTPSLSVAPEECPNLLACSPEYTPPADSSYITIPLTCSCLQLTNCPDTCVSNGTGDEVLPPSASPPVETGLSFQGPGTVTCKVEDFLLAPCLPVQTQDCSDEAAATARKSCDTNFDAPAAGSETVEIVLPCSCISMSNCVASCTFASATAEDTTAQDGTSNTLDEIPSEVTGVEPTAAPIAADPVDDTTTTTATEEPNNTVVTSTNAPVPAPADSPIVSPTEPLLAGSPSAVTTQSNGLVNFRGPGLVVCPITAYKANPCCKFEYLAYPRSKRYMSSHDLSFHSYIR